MSVSALTITCHDVCNHGASLQACALAAYLQDHGCQARIIDYLPDYLRHEASYWRVPNPAWAGSFLRRMIYRIVKFPRNRLFARRRAAFDRFNQHYLPRTDRRWFSSEQLREEPPRADLYICGSDQIWNPLFPNGRDGAFYLDFAPAEARRISYAASFATESIPAQWRESIKERIGKLDAVSVRESSGVRILSGMGIEARTVVDPVFLQKGDFWKKIAADSPLAGWLGSQKYLLLYRFEGDDMVGAAARRLADSRGLKLFSVNGDPLADRSFDRFGPDTFLSLILSAESILATSFHAAAFSVLFHKEFLIARRREAINTRMADLLASLGLADRLIDPTETDNRRSEIDWAAVENLLTGEKSRSERYLQENIARAAQRAV